MYGRQFVYNNLCSEFYINFTHSLVADAGSQLDGGTDVVSA